MASKKRGSSGVRGTARGYTKELRDRGIRIDRDGRAREGGRFVSGSRLTRIVGGLKAAESRRARSQHARERIGEIQELRTAEAEAEDLEAFGPEAAKERRDYEAEITALRAQVLKSQEENEKLRAELASHQIAETYEERIERFLLEGKTADDQYNEVRAIAARFGRNVGDVFSDLKGSPRGVGAVAR